MNLFLLHGFLGRPADWSSVKGYLSLNENLRIFVPDYFKEALLNPQHTFESWAENFTRWVDLQGCSKDKNILVGYSLGGRLALHALKNRPELWAKSLFVSTNPGFNDDLTSFDPESPERKQRWINDSYWAEEFLKAPWDSVLRNWNSQAVFSGGSEEPARLEKDYSRENLSLALTQWSLAQQQNMRPLLQAQANKTLWLVGERDEKFLDLSRRLVQDIPKLNMSVIPGASHRVLFDCPKLLSEKILSLLA